MKSNSGRGTLSLKVAAKPSLTYECLVIHDPSKKKKLKKSKDGWYEVIAGAFNTPSYKGMVYPLTPMVRDQYTGDNAMTRALSKRQLYGEMGHPTPLPGQSMLDFMARVAVVNEKNWATVYRKHSFKEATSDTGKPYILSVVEVKPFGTHKNVVEESFNDPSINSALSMRCITDYPAMRNGQWEKDITSHVTWDFVGEQGMPDACKYLTPSMESLSSPVVFTQENTNARQLSLDDYVGMESLGTGVERILTDAGWLTVVEPTRVQRKGFLSL